MKKTIACVVGVLWCALYVSAAPTDDIYKLGPDSQKQEGVPEGKIVGPLTLESNSVYPGTSRNYWVYVPAQYQKEKPACLMVFQDGHFFVNVSDKGQYRIPIVFDNLIYRREMPVTIAVFINPGRTPEQKEATDAAWGDRENNRALVHELVALAHAEPARDAGVLHAVDHLREFQEADR